MSQPYRPRLLLIIVCALIVGQIFVITSMKQEFEQQLLAAQQAVNTQTLLQSALVNLLVENDLIAREDLLREAQSISRQFMEETSSVDPPFDTTGLMQSDPAADER